MNRLQLETFKNSSVRVIKNTTTLQRPDIVRQKAQFACLFASHYAANSESLETFGLTETIEAWLGLAHYLLEIMLFVPRFSCMFFHIIFSLFRL